MAVSAFTVANIKPALNIDNSQRFIFGGDSGGFPEALGSCHFDNIFVPVTGNPASTILGIRNNGFSGFRLNHITAVGDTIGTLKLQSFTPSTITDLMIFGNSGISFTNNLDLQNNSIINAADPTTPQGLVTVSYMDTAIEAAIGSKVITLTGAVTGSGELGTSIATTLTPISAGEIYDFSVYVTAFHLNQFQPPNGNMNFNGYRLMNVPGPQAASDAANQYYVDSRTLTLTGDVTGTGTVGDAIGGTDGVIATTISTIPASKIAGYPSNTTTYLRGDGSWVDPNTGTWTGGVIPPQYGGTGVANNNANTLTLGAPVSILSDFNIGANSPFAIGVDSPVNIGDGADITLDDGSGINISSAGYLEILAPVSISAPLIIDPSANGVHIRGYISTGGDVDIAGDFVVNGVVGTHLGFNIAGTTTLDLPTTGTVAVLTNRLDQFAPPVSSLNIGSQLLTNVATPINPTDGVNKAYADSLIGSAVITLTGAVTGTNSGGTINTALSSVVYPTSALQTLEFNNLTSGFVLSNPVTPGSSQTALMELAFLNVYGYGFQLTHKTPQAGLGGSLSYSDLSLTVHEAGAFSTPFEIANFSYSSAASSYITNFNSSIKIDVSGGTRADTAGLYVIGGDIHVANEATCIRASSYYNVTKIELENTLGGKLFELRCDYLGNFNIFDRDGGFNRLAIDNNGITYIDAVPQLLATVTNYSTAMPSPGSSPVGTLTPINAMNALSVQYSNCWAYSSDTFTYRGSYPIISNVLITLIYTWANGSSDFAIVVLKNGAIINYSTVIVPGSGGGGVSTFPMTINTGIPVTYGDAITINLYRIANTSSTYPPMTIKNIYFKLY